MKFWLLMLLGTLGVLVLLRITYAIVTKSIGSYIERKHRAMEHILDTRRPPPQWLSHQPKPAAAAKAACLKRLDRLLRYTRGSALVADEQTRTELTDAMHAIRSEWNQADWGLDASDPR